VAELPKLTLQQIEQISNPQTLDDNQHEFMALHFKMNHLPFPAMITLAKNKRINKKFVWLKHRLPICMSCIFGTSHHKPWHVQKELMDQFTKTVIMHQANALAWIDWSLLNQVLFHKWLGS
jgi:hypothetical protein